MQLLRSGDESLMVNKPPLSRAVSLLPACSGILQLHPLLAGVTDGEGGQQRLLMEPCWKEKEKTES